MNCVVDLEVLFCFVLFCFVLFCAVFVFVLWISIWIGLDNTGCKLHRYGGASLAPPKCQSAAESTNGGGCAFAVRSRVG